MQVKICSTCKINKPIEEFKRDRNRKDGRYPICKNCDKLYAKKRRERYPNDHRIANKKCYDKNKKKYHETGKKWKKKNPDKVRIYEKKCELRRYGITLDEYTKLAARQGNVCGICSSQQIKRYKYLTVDHCHKTGKIRGLLCATCNLALGLLGDSLKDIHNILQYLEKNNVE